MSQEIINWILGGFGALLGFLLNSVWQSLNDLRAADKALAEKFSAAATGLAEKVASIEVLVAGDYVKKEEFNMTVTALFAKLDRIEDKLDRKADK